MVGYLIRRIGQALIVLFIVTVATLALVHLFPGGPIRALLGPRATVAQVAYYNHLYGFDQPFYVQYLKWVGQILHGNFGFSVKLNIPVASLIAQDLPKTIVLVGLGTIVSLAFGIPLGMYQAVHRYTAGDYVLTGVSFLGYATPTFFVALLLVEWFSVDTHLFPPLPRSRRAGWACSRSRGPWCCRSPRSRSCCCAVEPVHALLGDGQPGAGLRPHGPAKGAGERRVLWGHIFRNSLTSIVTLLGLSLPALVAGAIFIEVVFNYPGMGLAFYNAALNVDYQVLLGFTVLATVATILGNLLADIGYAMLDPRVRYS